MKVLEIKDICKKDSPILYRLEFTGNAVIETIDKKTLEKKIEFILEKTSHGKSQININLLEDINFPLLPAIKKIKAHIYKMEKMGLL